MYLSEQSAYLYDVAEPHYYRWSDLEEALVNWWLDQAEQSSELITTDGGNLIIVDAGQRNDGPGPDIQNCHLIIDDIELVGSVEMHLKAKDWYQHGHDINPAFNSVILHVVKEVQGGPDLATLQVANQCLGEHFCLARRPVNNIELLQLAEKRFRQKADHLRLLSSAAHSYSPLLLGMIETILAGPSRHKRLHEVAFKIGIDAWPDSRRWQGSNQVFPGSQSLPAVINKILLNASLLAPSRWSQLPVQGWSDWDKLLAPLRRLGISKYQGREWVVNVLAPYHERSAGFRLWLDTPVFRHYGIERKGSLNLGVGQVNRIYIQQAILGWTGQLCSNRNCSVCPLSHSHHSLD